VQVVPHRIEPVVARREHEVAAAVRDAATSPRALRPFTAMACMRSSCAALARSAKASGSVFDFFRTVTTARFALPMGSQTNPGSGIRVGNT
jgi:hypothetical protein